MPRLSPSRCSRRDAGSRAARRWGLSATPSPRLGLPPPQLLVTVGHSETRWDLGMPRDPVETGILAQSQEAKAHSACWCQSSKEAPGNVRSLCQAKGVRWRSAKHPKGQASPPGCSFQMLGGVRGVGSVALPPGREGANKERHRVGVGKTSGADRNGGERRRRRPKLQGPPPAPTPTGGSQDHPAGR